MLLNKLIAPVPMGRCWPSIEQTCIGQNKGTSADGTQTTDLCALFSEPTQKVGRMPFVGRPVRRPRQEECRSDRATLGTSGELGSAGRFGSERFGLPQPR